MAVFSLIGKELGQSLKVLVKSAKKGLPHNATCFDKFVINGKTEAGEVIQKEIIIFKNAQGQVLKRRIETQIQNDTFVQTRNYQNCDAEYNELVRLSGGKSTFIHTNEYKNGKRVLTEQETISGILDNDNKTNVTRTKINRKFDQTGESTETHYIGKFKHRLEPEELKFSFNRDKNGFISSPLEIEKTLKTNEYKIDFSDEYLPTYLQTDKKSLARDLVQIRMKKEGFGTMCDVIPFHKNLQDEAMSFGNANVSNVDINTATQKYRTNYIKPRIAILTDQDKLSMVECAGHESQHLRQYGATFDESAISLMDKNIQRFWQNSSILKSELAKSNAIIVKQLKEAFFQNIETKYLMAENKISQSEAHKRYSNNFIETNAQQKGELVLRKYQEKCKRFMKSFYGTDWFRIFS